MMSVKYREISGLRKSLDAHQHGPGRRHDRVRMREHTSRMVEGELLPPTRTPVEHGRGVLRHVRISVVRRTRPSGKGIECQGVNAEAAGIGEVEFEHSRPPA